MRTTVRRGVGLIALGLLVLTAACGDDDDDAATGEDGGSASGSAGEAATAAEERLAPYLEPADSIGIEEPLSGEMPEGLEVYWLEGNIQSILPITQGFEEATEATGWDLTTLTYDPADPQGPGSAMQQAVDGGADYIAVSGQTIDILGPALDAAKSAGIPVIDMYSTDEVGGEENGIYANIGGPGYSEASFPVLVDYVISDSGGEANVLFVNIPDFQILQTVADATLGQFESECPECEVETLDVTIADLTSGAVSSQVVSSIQSNPDIEYVFVSIGDLATGLPEALSSGGAENVQLLGGVPNPEQLQSLADGTSVAWIPLPRPMSAWAAVDAMARIELGQEIDQEQHEVLPIEMKTQDNIETPVEEYEGPEGYQDQFNQLWGIDGG
jgi:ribose transport system substrate-binding protein